MIFFLNKILEFNLCNRRFIWPLSFKIWTSCKIRHHVFTTFDARIWNLKCKNKDVLEVLKSSKYISLFEPRQV